MTASFIHVQLSSVEMSSGVNVQLSADRELGVLTPLVNDVIAVVDVFRRKLLEEGVVCDTNGMCYCHWYFM